MQSPPNPQLPPPQKFLQIDGYGNDVATRRAVESVQLLARSDAAVLFELDSPGRGGVAEPRLLRMRDSSGAAVRAEPDCVGLPVGDDAVRSATPAPLGVRRHLRREVNVPFPGLSRKWGVWAVAVALGAVAVVAAIAAPAAPGTPRCTWHDMTAAVPSSAVLTDVAAISDADVWAVGSTYPPDYSSATLPLILHWNGRTWTRVHTPLKKWQQPTSVSASSGTDVWVAAWNFYDGSASTMHWDGGSWRVVAIPTDPRSDNSNFQDVVALPGGEAWAVGADRGQPGTDLPLLRHWSDKRWEVVKPPLPPATTAELVAVAGTSRRNVWAVGYSGSPPTRAYVLKWDGSRLRRLTLPQSQYVQSELSNILVRSPTQVWVFGTTDTNPDRGESGKSAAYNLSWDGSRWRSFGYSGYDPVSLARRGGFWAVSPRDNGVYRLNNGTATRVTTIPWANAHELSVTETRAGRLWASGYSNRPHLAAYSCS